MAESQHQIKAMYKIIGADGQQYGPVNAEQLRLWIAEGRVNARSLIQVEGATEWTPISASPEFASDLKPPTPPTGQGSAPQPFPQSYTPPTPVNPVIASKASSKIAAGICGILLGSLGIHKFILGYTSAGLIMLLVTILTCGIAGWVMWIIGLIEGIVYLAKSDEDFVRTYVDGRKEWF
jgi:TM2 domain-containing membrane protein YozV